MGSLTARIGRGVVAGAAGTLAMDLLWYRRYRSSGGDQSFVDWELATETRSFDEASAPGKAAQKIANAVGVELPDEAAGTATNVMHWLTGEGYGIVHALLLHRRGVLAAGATTGIGAFANSYAMLGAMGLYQPIWEYDADTLKEDLSAHLLFGVVTSLTYRALTAVVRRSAR